MSALPDQLQSPRSASARSAGGSDYHSMNPLLRVGGGLGLVGVLMGLALFVLSCAGFDGSLYFSPAVLVFAIASGSLTLIAAHRSPGVEDSKILASLFLALLGILGGLLELAIWLQWPIMFGQHG